MHRQSSTLQFSAIAEALDELDLRHTTTYEDPGVWRITIARTPDNRFFVCEYNGGTSRCPERMVGAHGPMTATDAECVAERQRRSQRRFQLVAISGILLLALGFLAVVILVLIWMF